MASEERCEPVSLCRSLDWGRKQILQPLLSSAALCIGGQDCGHISKSPGGGRDREGRAGSQPAMLAVGAVSGASS